MDSINKVELQGPIFGLKESIVGQYKIYNFTLSTSYIYKSKDGSMYCETTHHAIQAINPDIDGELKDKKYINVVGRLKDNKYLDFNNNERSYTTIIASKIKVLE